MQHQEGLEPGCRPEQGRCCSTLQPATPGRVVSRRLKSISVPSGPICIMSVAPRTSSPLPRPACPKAAVISGVEGVAPDMPKSSCLLGLTSGVAEEAGSSGCSTWGEPNAVCGVHGARGRWGGLRDRALRSVPGAYGGRGTGACAHVLRPYEAESLGFRRCPTFISVTACFAPAIGEESSVDCTAWATLPMALFASC